MADRFFQPVSGTELARYAGVPTFMRLPLVPVDHPRRGAVDVGFLGLPWDGGTSNRPGARHGPRALRDASTMIRAMNRATGQRPFETLNAADLGDVAMSPVDQDEALAAATAAVAGLDGIRPILVGGDHLCTLAVLRGLFGAMGPRGAPAAVADDGDAGSADGAALREAPALILFDSHTDLYPPYFGGRTLTHGNPFRQAVTEGLIAPGRSTMIGMRGTSYNDDDFQFGRDHGIRIVPIEEYVDLGWRAAVDIARQRAGTGPVYLSYDIDFVDPAVAPGTGTPEVGGPNAFEAIQVVRALHGLDIRGADLVEVSPPFDVGGITAWLGASLLFEILCAMA